MRGIARTPDCHPQNKHKGHGLCTACYARKRSAENSHVATGYMRRRYGITLDDYNALLAKQGGGCAVCRKSEAENGQRLCVDHDHSCCPTATTCGKCIRGLLCSECNKSLGHLDDDLERIMNLAQYVAKTKNVFNHTLLTERNIHYGKHTEG